MNENDLRDCFAMFALLGLVTRFNNETPIEVEAYRLADRMLEARKYKDETESDDGIATIKKRKYVRKD